MEWCSEAVERSPIALTVRMKSSTVDWFWRWMTAPGSYANMTLSKYVICRSIGFPRSPGRDTSPHLVTWGQWQLTPVASSNETAAFSMSIRISTERLTRKPAVSLQDRDPHPRKPRSCESCSAKSSRTDSLTWCSLRTTTRPTKTTFTWEWSPENSGSSCTEHHSRSPASGVRIQRYGLHWRISAISSSSVVSSPAMPSMAVILLSTVAAIFSSTVPSA